MLGLLGALALGGACGGGDATRAGAGADAGARDAGTADAGAADADGGLSAAERAALADEPPRAPGLADSVAPIAHFHMARQASTYLAGPGPGDALVVEEIDLAVAFGEAVGPSPWHVVGPPAPDGRWWVWGATLTDAYVLGLEAGEPLRALDRFPINAFPTSIPWNLAALADGRVLVPDPDGYREARDAARCGGTVPSALVLALPADAEPPRAGCDAAVPFAAAALRAACGVERGVLARGVSGVNTFASFDGSLGTVVAFDEGEVRTTYAVVHDPVTQRLVGCGRIDDSLQTNAIAAEPEGADATALYVATEDAIVKLRHVHATGEVRRVWERVVPVRRRTGTTPTLVDTPDGARFVVTVDARCAVVSVSNGLIACSDDPAPSRLVAVRRDDDVPPGAEAVITADLPAWLDTVENSPAARRDVVVVANYSGYLPNGLEVPAGGVVPEASSPAAWLESPDAVARFATGIVAMVWRPERGRFEALWEVRDRQVNSVPTISAGANLVYGSGAEVETGRTVLYGFRLRDDADGPAGAEVLRVPLGAAPFREPIVDADGDVVFARDDYTLRPGEVFDPGNSQLVLPDRSLLLSMGRALVHVRAR